MTKSLRLSYYTCRVCFKMAETIMQFSNCNFFQLNEVTNQICVCVFSGLIGRSWAMVFISGGYNVKIYDNQPGQAAKAMTAIRSAFLHNTVNSVRQYWISYWKWQSLHTTCKPEKDINDSWNFINSERRETL